MKHVSFLGAGSWGTALAILCANNGHQVTIWSKVKAETDMLKEHREHLERLPGVKLPDSIVIEEDLEKACTNQDVIVWSVASPFVRSTAQEAKPFIKDNQIIVNVGKGIEENTLMTLCEILEDELPMADVCVLSGPSHAEEVSHGVPTTVVVGAKTEKTAMFVQDVFMSDRFRVYTSPDMIGIELGGALKNVIALAAGILDGMGLGDNTKAALMTRGIAEISRLGVELGGKMETFCGLSGIGDLIVTCISTHSRNHNCGYMLGQGKTLEEAKKEIKQLLKENTHSKDKMQQESIACPIKGCVIELEEVGDEAFSGGMLGEGFAVKPEEGKLYAPVDGIIAAVFRTKHALAMESKDGAEVLIHLGLDTVKRGGKGFYMKVEAGQKVKKGELICEFDLEDMRVDGYVMTTPVVISNNAEYASISLKHIGECNVGEEILTLYK